MKVNYFIVSIPILIILLIFLYIKNRKKSISHSNIKIISNLNNINKDFDKTNLLKDVSNNSKNEVKKVNQELWYSPIAPINKNVFSLRALPTYSNIILYDNFVYLVNSLGFRLTKDNQYTYSGKPIFLMGKSITLKIGNLINKGSFDNSKLGFRSKMLYGIVFYIIYEKCDDPDILNYIISNWGEKICSGLYLSLWDNEGKAWFPNEVDKEIDTSSIWKQFYDSGWANPLTIKKDEGSDNHKNNEYGKNLKEENSVDSDKIEEGEDKIKEVQK